MKNRKFNKFKMNIVFRNSYTKPPIEFFQKEIFNDIQNYKQLIFPIEIIKITKNYAKLKILEGINIEIYLEDQSELMEIDEPSEYNFVMEISTSLDKFKKRSCFAKFLKTLITIFKELNVKIYENEKPKTFLYIYTINKIEKNPNKVKKSIKIFNIEMKNNYKISYQKGTLQITLNRLDLNDLNELFNLIKNNLHKII